MTPTPIQTWLDTFCQESAGVAGGVVVRAEAGDGELAVVGSCENVDTRSHALKLAAGEALQRNEPVHQVDHETQPDGSKTSEIVSLPVRNGAHATGAIALELREAQAGQSKAVLAQLEQAATALADAMTYVTGSPSVIDAADVLQFQATVLSHGSFKAAATAFASELAAALKLDHVAIGFRDGKYCRVEAISNFADFESRTKIFRIISIAMDEAIGQGAAIAYPGIPDDRPRINVAQSELARRRSSVVCSVPLVSREQVIGAITLEREGNVPLRKEEIADFEQIACMIGPILALKRDSERPWYWRLTRSLTDIGNRLLKPGNVLAKGAALTGLTAIVAAFLVPVDYQIGAPARLEGSIQRALVAPADGFLKQAHVRPGDAVKAGQVLIELAQNDLELERRKWESQLAQHENAAPAALARSDRGQFVISQSLADEARAKLGLVEEQITRTQVRSPFDGLVIMGDLSQMLGAPVRRGETLVTVSPVNEYRLIVEVEERDIAEIEVGQKGRLALGALHRQNFSFQVQRISPVAASLGGQNVFEVEGKLDRSDKTMRPGLEGVARIDIDQRSLAWILTHRIIDWARVAAWSLGI